MESGMTAYGFGRCDGRHEMVDFRLRKKPRPSSGATRRLNFRLTLTRLTLARGRDHFLACRAGAATAGARGLVAGRRLRGLAPQDSGHRNVAPLAAASGLTPRAVRARAMPRMLLTPLASISLMIHVGELATGFVEARRAAANCRPPSFLPCPWRRRAQPWCAPRLPWRRRSPPQPPSNLAIPFR